jgi:outer membrane lipoprotein-sorting protein
MIKRMQMVSMMAVALMAAAACGQTTAPAEDAAAQVAALDPLARDTLKMLQERRGTLKDFQAKVNYDVNHKKTEDREGKLGNVDYLSDPQAGSTFSVRFTVDTADGTPIKKHAQDLAFDGTNITLIDRAGKTYTRSAVVAPGSSPGDATSLNGKLPLPIGLEVDDVVRNFDVTVLPSKGADEVVLKLVPRPAAAAKFPDFKQLEITVDKKLQLPTKIVRTERNGDLTTVEFSDIAINTGKSKMVDTTLPTGADWMLDLK